MKNSKYLLLAAIAAATAMVSSCSDNGDLSTSTKETKGKCDLLVDVSVDGSRASALTGTKFSTFKLFGYQNPPTGSSAAAKGFLDGANGVDFEGAVGSTWTTDAEALWPAETDQSNNFYAISTYGYDETEADTINSATLGTEFNTAGLQNGSFTYTSTNSSYIPDYRNEVYMKDVEGISDEEFANLLTPTSYVNSATQKDIVVSASIETFKGSTGKITLPFKHAFAYVTFELNFANQIAKKVEGAYTNETQGMGVPETEMFAIDYIAIHGVKTNGTFTFAKDGDTWKGTWDSSSSDYGVVKYVWGIDNPLILHCNTTTPTSTNPIIYTPILTDGQAMMIIPQVVNSDGAPYWDEDTNTPDVTPEKYAYIEIHGVFWNTANSFTDYNDGTGEGTPGNSQTPYSYFTSNGNSYSGAMYESNFGEGTEASYFTSSIYCAIPANFEFKMNKHYNIRMFLPNFKTESGSGVLEGAYDPD